MANTTMRMLWFALVASQGMYGVVACLVEVPPGDGELVTVLTPVFALLSHSYDLQFHAKPGYGTSAHIGAAIAGIALAPAPLTLPLLGSFYLAPPLLVLPPVAIPPSTAMGQLTLPIPGNPALVGVPLYFQGLILNQAVPTDAHFTGYVTDVIRQ